MLDTKRVPPPAPERSSDAAEVPTGAALPNECCLDWTASYVNNGFAITSIVPLPRQTHIWDQLVRARAISPVHVHPVGDQQASFTPPAGTHARLCCSWTRT